MIFAVAAANGASPRRFRHRLGHLLPRHLANAPRRHIPVPLAGMGMSPILGFWLGIGLLSATAKPAMLP